MESEIPPKILIVDDEPQNLDLMEAYLSHLYEITLAESGEECLQKVEEKDIDLILLDIMMPGMSGYDVAKTLKESESTRHIPIIMVTALSEKEDRIKSIEVGADDFLTKPVNRVELLTRVKSLLRIKSLHDELVAEKEHLKMQNHIRRVLTSIIPALLSSAPPEQKKIIIRQMVDMVEDIVRSSCTDCEKEIKDSQDVARICCEAMNQLGASYFVDGDGDQSGCSTIKAHKCPWGEESKINPIMCNLTTGVFSKMVNGVTDGEVNVNKTMGNGDDHCCFDICIEGE
ncbi:methanogen output domain 1-containing protein [Methanohalophilus mahii]|uniref:Response regulator receiver protein n=1 Tax=Methanohalophilus mahii (strain ATCC 35705 / DSM 5219 / SLP) TaxID=547558 RepID=D5EBI8_METMS|nr:methanogen output domain 1-containing protein [Methanohalophilus mahii]ADE36539.1 response regulator receiver protein [Methanohalophilus mahii DSM 5219]